MKTRLMSGLSLVAVGLALTLQTPAGAERSTPRRAPARSAVGRGQASIVPVAPVRAPTASAARVGWAPSAAASSPLSSPLEVRAGCVPVWVVDGRGARRLADRCPAAPRPRGAQALQASAPRVARPPSVGVRRGAARIAPSAPAASAPAASAPAANAAAANAAAVRAASAPPPTASVTPRRRPPKKKPPATCARFTTWIDASGVRRSRPRCP